MASRSYLRGNRGQAELEYAAKICHDMNVPEKLHPIGIDYQILIGGAKDKGVTLVEPQTIEVATTRESGVDRVIEEPNCSHILDRQMSARNSVDSETVQSQLAQLSQQIKRLESENRSRTRKEFWIYTLWLGLVTYEIAKFVLSTR